MTSMTPLADCVALPCGATLNNRIAKAAMSEQLSDPGGSPSEQMIRVYQRWGVGGAGLLITGHVMVDRRHVSEAGNVAIEDERHLTRLKRWAHAATCDGAHAWLQLNHPGRQTPRVFDAAPVSPSAVPLAVGARAFAPPRALVEAEIQDIIERFAKAAAVAKHAGFTGVQIHGAHGYLVSQFLSPLTNQRSDGWGGDEDRRSRFLLDIVRATRAAVGASFAIGVKLNSADFQRGGFSEDASLRVIAALGRVGVDLLEISGGTYERAAMFAEPTRASTRDREAFFVEFAEQARAVATMPLMVTGGFRSRGAMELAVTSGAVDVVGMARPLAVEPDLPRRLLSGQQSKAVPVRLATGIATLDSMITGTWYQQQIRRMGRGLDPSPSLTRVSALARTVSDYVKLRRRR